MRTIGELRAALTMGYGFPGDADDFEAELARRINHADPAAFPVSSASWRSTAAG
ncbi:hypothetical protein [Streptomyces olivaceus]|uniref:hypothetical protein n=1 Tax=Streptomyces olivaceus TaxID=47716 RepID=UPI0018857AF6|nr:hypothetical protein [Streptomyces olivaceus]